MAVTGDGKAVDAEVGAVVIEGVVDCAVTMMRAVGKVVAANAARRCSRWSNIFPEFLKILQVSR
jgi:hypothetical protein